MIVTSSFVISIITGIICDTFGELRTAQDDSQNYRATTCFVTNISFATVRQTTMHAITSLLKSATIICSDRRSRFH
eukprot:COSAG06_NODE_182_length_20899_cov_89.175048_24_plen_76_part_00